MWKWSEGLFKTHQKLNAVVQLLSQVQLFATPWTAACQASLSFTISWIQCNHLKYKLKRCERDTGDVVSQNSLMVDMGITVWSPCPVKVVVRGLSLLWKWKLKQGKRWGRGCGAENHRLPSWRGRTVETEGPLAKDKSQETQKCWLMYLTIS